MNKKRIIIKFIITIVVLFSLALCLNYQMGSDKIQIQTYMKKYNNTVLDTDYQSTPIDIPFIVCNKGDRIYKITYKDEDRNIKTAWVRIGLVNTKYVLEGEDNVIKTK